MARCANSALRGDILPTQEGLAQMSWETELRKALRRDHGKGWSVQGQSKGTKLTYRDPSDGSRSSVMLTIAWLPANELEIRNEVQHLRKRMLERNISLRAAHGIDGAALSSRGQFNWKHAHDQFLLSVAGLKETTIYDLRIRLGRVLGLLLQRPAPKDAAELMRAYSEQFLADLSPGSEGRKANLQTVSRFLKFAVDDCDAPKKWQPIATKKRQALVGPADGRDAKLTPPVKPEQLESLLDALEADGRHDLRLAVGLVGLFGLRPAELATLELQDNGDLKAHQVKRNAGDMKKSAKQQAKEKQRLVLPLDLPGREGLGAQLAAQWGSGLIKLPPQIASAVAAGDLKGTGDALRQYLNRYRPWRDLVATTPGLTPYSLRHGWAWRAHKLYDRPLSIRDASALMGHDAATHSKYYGSWTDEDDLRATVANLTATKPAAVAQS